MDILFIGGTGRLSKDTAALAAEDGLNVTLLTRGSSDRSILFPAGCNSLKGDIRDAENCRHLLQGRHFDAVIDYISYNPSQLDNTLDVVSPHCSQYIFISSATVYEETSEEELISEEKTPVGNREWRYAWDKSLCERRLAERYEEGSAPQYTIVRPYVTYGNTRIPYPLVPFDTMKEWSFVERVRLGLPVPTFDGGRTLTTLTHTRDFAKGMVGLFGNERAYGEAYHITNDEEVTWSDVLGHLETALGVKVKAVDVPRSELYRKIPEYRAVVEGDKGRTTRFDSSKIREAVPDFVCDITLAAGIADTVAYLTAHPQLQKIDWRWMGQMDRLMLSAEEARRAQRLYGFCSSDDRLRYMVGYHGVLEKAVRTVSRAIGRAR